MSSNFTYHDYRKIVKAGIDNGYKYQFYWEEQEEKCILFRHDVDFDLEGALRQAQIEYDLGAKSTFFIFLRSPFYNVLSTHGKLIIKQIIALGHDIGLHFDDNYNETEIVSAIRMEAEFMEKEFGYKIQVVSFHRPGLLAKGDTNIEPYINAYSFNEDKGYMYASDSNTELKSGPLDELISANNYPKLQILTHPIWWTEEVMNREAKVETFIKGNVGALKQLTEDTLYWYKV